MTTVLYVDDEPPLRRAVHAWLKRHGTVVHVARGIEAAKECLARHDDVDGVFIDLWLSDGSGFELFDWLAEHNPALARNVTFVTGDIVRTPATQSQLRMLERPLLTKPFDLTELDHFVELWGSGDAPADPRPPAGGSVPGPGGAAGATGAGATKSGASGAAGATEPVGSTRPSPRWEPRPGA